MTTSTFNRHSRRGSVLIVALIFAIIIAISLVSYLALANNSLKQAGRSFYASSGINLAEIGLEQALACFNQLNATTPAAAWAGWTIDNTPYDATTSPLTPSATRTFSGFKPGPGATGTVKVIAQHYTGSTPTTTPRIVAQATITPHVGPPIQKYIEVILRKRSLLGYGVSAIDDITVSGGNFEGKSWDSDPNDNGVLVPYDDTKNTANLIMGSVTGNISLGGGEVWGYTKVSSADHSDVGGTVHGLGSTTNDPDRRTDDFNASFPMQTAPAYGAYTTITTTINSTTTFPLNVADPQITIPSGQVNAGEQAYVYKFAAGAGITLSGGTNHISVAPGKNVIFLLESHATAEAIKITGGSTYVEVGAAGSLHVYTNGDVNIAGSGVLNQNIDSKSFMIWGTDTGAQSIKVAGNGQFTGVVYAPNANVEVKGGGTSGKVVGAIVGKTVYFNGTTTFYYDEELSELTLGNPYGASKWRELRSANERAVHAAALSFE